eukprot:g1786.t1
MRSLQLKETRTLLTNACSNRSRRRITSRTPNRVGATSDTSSSTEEFNAWKFRRSLRSTGRYTKRPTNDEASMNQMEQDGSGYSKTGLVAEIRKNQLFWQQGEVRIYLAEAMGYCWGVERAVQMAYEAHSTYPDRTMHLTNEIIHNPDINDKMKEMGYNFIDAVNGDKDFSNVQKGDVVLLPAFGATAQEMQLLNDREVQIVDTTCPWVSKVWSAVDKQAKKKHTSVIHGKWQHEETVATASFASDYVVVRDMKEAQYVCNHILNGGNKEEFLTKFENAISRGFDPDTMLERVGLANQTTMLKGETQAIGKLMEQTMMKKYGPENLNDHFMVMDTICDATQERQDAMYKLTENENIKLDLFIVIGGFNSSNTSHLQEIAEVKGIPSYWITGVDCIDIERNKITYQDFNHNLLEKERFLPDGPLNIGITSGASTPDKPVEQVLDAVFKIKNPSYVPMM